MENRDFRNFIQLLKIKNFSKKTITSYVYYNIQFLNFTNKSPREIKQADIKNYLEYLVDKKYSASTLNLAYSALKNYYYNTYKRKFFVNLPRAKKDKKLPVVLSKKEIKKIISSTDNLKHKCLLSLLYGCGLRASEAVKIKMSDIDIERMALAIRESKGKKDRYVVLPKKIIKTLRAQICVKNKNDYLFTGRDKKKSLTLVSVNKIVKQASKKANINKNISAHTLRHSFAAHLLENGINIRYIQTLLGHARLETTQIYTKVANNKLSEIASPLD